MNTILCPRCDGTGGRPALSVYHAILGLSYERPQCDYCKGQGILGEFTEVRLVTRASLCEICGCRSFKGKCTVNKDFHDAHAFYTRRIREGQVYFVPEFLFKHRLLDRYETRCWTHQGAACGFETKEEQALVGWASLSVDEAEDLNSTIIAEIKDGTPMDMVLEAARLVRETNLPLWEALNRSRLHPDDVLLSRTMGYPPRARRSTPNPVSPPGYWCIAIPSFVPTWLQSAWEMGYPTCYDEKDYEHLKRRPEVHGE